MNQTKSNLMDIPKVGWKASLDYVFPEKRDQTMKPKLKQILPIIPLILRYAVYAVKLWWKGRKLLMDFICPAKNDEKSGVPLGGIGGGTIGRGFRGEFCHFQMLPGIYEYETVVADQFIVTIQNKKMETIYQKVLTAQKKPKGRQLETWDWSFPANHADYTALFPRSWTVFKIPEHDIQLICQQVSPVIPHNYKDSCIPAAVFEWFISNNSNEEKSVSITFTMKNGTGGKFDSSGKLKSQFYQKNLEDVDVKGITINQEICNIPYSYSIGVNSKPQISVSECLYFDPNGDGKEIWNSLWKNGQLRGNNYGEYVSGSRNELACGLCAKVEVPANSNETLEFSLAWDMPKVTFPLGKIQYTRYYTKYFGSSGLAGPDICSYSLLNYKRWQSEIHDWQEKYIEDDSLPGWLKSALFNELYYISDGGTLWVLKDNSEDFPPGDPRLEYGRFAYLEGHEYRMYNTYDVHFYGSFALSILWPHLQASLQYDIRDSIKASDNSLTWFLYDGKHSHRKVQNTVPHDVGNPDEAPFICVNAYNIHDISEWKDLNLKFVLQVYRDYSLHRSIIYLKDMYPQVIDVINYALKWDVDNDGMIENSGFPDQTYDAWIMCGTSAYCGSLWVGTLYAAKEIAAIVGDFQSEDKYFDMFNQAKSSFEKKLWNGRYYNFDCSTGNHSASIMADQLCGLWYLRCSGAEKEIFPESNVKKALQTIYDYNVKSYFGGSQGAVNGMLPDRSVDDFAVQSEEVWTGVTYGLASLMISEGLVEEGFKTAKGIYETVYEKSGLGFATPEALHGLDGCRSISYMRPLSVWSIPLALKKIH